LSGRRLTLLVVVFPLLSLLFYGGLSHLFLLYLGKQEQIRDLKRYEWTRMEIEKNLLKEKVESLARFVRYYDNRGGDRIKRDAKRIVRLVAAVADNLCRYGTDGSVADMKKLLAGAFGGIRFENDMGYLFMLDMEGNVLLHPDAGMLGANIANIRDLNGKFIVREFQRVIRERGEGFVDYYWYLPNRPGKRMYYKISYVKKIACLDAYIGAGEYLRYMKRFVRDEILAYIRDNARFENGYFFITDSQNRFVLRPNIAEGPLLDYRVEGFYETNGTLAYTAYIAQYDWYLTAVENLTAVRTEMAQKAGEIEARGEADAETNLALLLLSWLLSLALSLWLSWVMNGMLRRYERQLKESHEKLIWQSRQALLGELLPMIAHQWRQPINKIASIVARLRFGHDRNDAEALDDHYGRIEESIEYMSETIDNFRRFYHPKGEAEEVDLAALIDKSITFLEEMLQKRGIRVETALQPMRLKLYGNELMQVMINLIKNAADAMPRGGTLTLRLRRRDGLAVIEVEDSGGGLREGTRERVFEAYYSTKGSTGLGLYMSKMIVEKHLGGRIEANNIPGGARFTIYLPSS